MQAISAALPKLREWAPAHLQVGASANGFKTTTTEWLGGGTTPDMLVIDGKPSSSLYTSLNIHCGTCSGSRMAADWAAEAGSPANAQDPCSAAARHVCGSNCDCSNCVQGFRGVQVA